MQSILKKTAPHARHRLPLRRGTADVGLPLRVFTCTTQNFPRKTTEKPGRELHCSGKYGIIGTVCLLYCGEDPSKGAIDFPMNEKAQVSADPKKTRRNTILIIIAVVVVAAVVIGLAIYANTSPSNSSLKKTVALSSEHYEVNGAMMTYFFYSSYQSYAGFLSTYYGLDTSKSLKTQNYSDEATWLDYMAAMSANYVKEILSLCEAANAAGMTVDADDQASIDASVAALAQNAQAEGYTLQTFLMTAFGGNVEEADVRDCLRLTALAAKYSAKFQGGLSYTTADYEAYYEENKNTYDGVDLITYTIKQNDLIEKDADGNPVGGVSDAASRAEEAAATIASATTAEDFTAAIAAYATEYLGYTPADAESLAARCSVTHLTATAGNAASEWAFSAQPGDTTIITESGGTSYSVYFLVRGAYRDETPTRTVRHILIGTDAYDDAKATADEVYKTWEDAGFALDTFDTLVTKYSTDTGSVTTGGLYENVAPGEMITEFNDWLFDPARKPGDHGIVETTYGYHIMYYVGEGEPNWVCDADEALRNNAYTAMLEENAGSIQMNADVIYSINA